MLLFKADMSGVYLTVNQGGGMMYSAPISVLDFLEDMEVGSIELSKEFLQLFNAGFSFDRNIDLADSGIIARTHEKATVVYKYYDRNYLPSEGEIESDISTVLYAYENFIGNSLSENLNFYEPTRKPIADNSTHTNSKLNGLETSPQEIEITQEVSHDKPVREEDFLNKQEQRAKQARDLPYDELLKRAVAPAKTDYQMVLSKRFVRNEYVARIAKSRANGKCQLCEQGAPFKDQNGEFFLEVHHIVWLSRNGKDVIENVVALCPNCHSKMHVLDLKKDKALLRRRVQPA
jgi:5-methylcytosine-specific restriction endonuclease McrA